MSNDWKFAYTTRRVSRRRVAGVMAGDHAPRAGDLVLAEVLEIGQHARLEGPDSRRASLFAGDQIVVCYGNRYAPDQFEGHVPADLSQCDLVGAGGDAWLMRDAGAEVVYDFTDAGVASTSLLDLPALHGIVDTLLGNLAAAGAEVAVFEVADGLLQAETAALVGSPRFAQAVDGMLFAAGEAMGAAAGVSWLRERGLPVLAISGVLTSAPLAVRETAAATGMPVLTYDELATGAVAESLIPRAQALLAA